MSNYSYNTDLSAIILPEYGRHIQDMVEVCRGLATKEERNQCASIIVRTMKSVSSTKRDSSVGEQVYWDHLAVISEFDLDIDFPEGTITQERLMSTPDKIPYISNKIYARYYGHLIATLVDEVSKMPMGKERAEAEYFLALQMKRNYMTWNNPLVEDERIFQDLANLSEGEIVLTPEECKLVINPNSIDRGGKQKVPKKMLGGK